MRTVAFLTLLPLFSLAACSGSPDGAPVGATDEDLSSQTASFFVSKGPGLTGGIGVEAVNLATTRCADGKRSSICPALGLDFGGSKLDDAEQSDASAAFRAGHALVKGKLATVKGAPTLQVSEVWMGQTEASIDHLWGNFYQVTKIAACSRVAGATCNEATEKLLNKTTSSEVASVDYSSSGASKTEVNAARAAMGTGDLLVAGYDQGVVRTSPALIVQEIYVKVTGSGGHSGAGVGQMCGGIAGFQCAAGLVCDMGSGPMHPDQAGKCRASDCRESGCGAGSSCQICWASFACVPKGAMC